LVIKRKQKKQKNGERGRLANLGTSMPRFPPQGMNQPASLGDFKEKES